MFWIVNHEFRLWLIDCDFSWKTHIHNISKSLNSNYNLILINLKGMIGLQQTYYSLVQSLIFQILYFFISKFEKLTEQKDLPNSGNGDSGQVVIDCRQYDSHSLWSKASWPPNCVGSASLRIWLSNCATDTVKTLSRSFSLTNRRKILKGALNHSGAVTINTFFNLAG